MRYYLGLATTFHDPALALVGPDGTVLFAEATERYLQYKRAPNCEPDSAPRMAGLLKAYLPPGAELVVAATWGPEFSRYLAGQAGAGAFGLEALRAHSPALNRSLVPERAERTFIAELALAQGRAGYGTLLGLDRAHGGRSTIAALRRYPH
ncbi:carbamoyltransferase, partial [Methylobacterium frigidaeris]